MGGHEVDVAVGLITVTSLAVTSTVLLPVSSGWSLKRRLSTSKRSSKSTGPVAHMSMRLSGLGRAGFSSMATYVAGTSARPSSRNGVGSLRRPMGSRVETSSQLTCPWGQCKHRVPSLTFTTSAGGVITLYLVKEGWLRGVYRTARRAGGSPERQMQLVRTKQ